MLPLHAAWIEDRSRPTRRRYAIDDFLISYAPNARSLRQVTRTSGMSLLGVDAGGPNAGLRYTAAEVNAAARRFDPTTILHPQDATRTNVLSVLHQYTVLHFACHGSADTSVPLESSLLLAGNERLTLRDIFNQPPLTARLCVLSACETAVTGFDLPDEVLSLPTGLLQAGFDGVIGTAWTVPDLSTALLMIRLYEQWHTRPDAPAQALREAQRWLRDATNGDLNAWLPKLITTPHVHDERAHTDWTQRRPYQAIEQWAAFIYFGT